MTARSDVVFSCAVGRRFYYQPSNAFGESYNTAFQSSAVPSTHSHRPRQQAS